MKKNIVYILFTGLIIAQIISLSKINNLQNQLENTRFEISNVSNNTRNEISGIYSNVDAMLKQEASLIESASTVLGELDINNLTALVTFTLVPKEVSGQTAVSLDIDGELFPMSKNGTTFSVTVPRDIFGSAMPMILIEENGVTKTTHDARIDIGSMKDSLLPSIHPRLVGSGSYSNGIYKRKGMLTVDVKGAVSGITITEARFIVEIDGEVISDETAPNDMLLSGWQVDKTIQLKDGQVCIMSVIATDSIGLEHRCTVDHWTGGNRAQREPWFDDEEIYSADEHLLWRREYKRID